MRPLPLSAVGEGVEKETLVKCTMYIDTAMVMRSMGTSSKKLRSRTTIWCKQSCFWVYTCREQNQYLKDIYVTPCSLSIVPHIGNHHVHQQIDECRYIYVNIKYFII